MFNNRLASFRIFFWMFWDHVGYFESFGIVKDLLRSFGIFLNRLGFF